LPANTVFKPQKCIPGDADTIDCSQLFDKLGAKRAKLMTLPSKEFLSAWMEKAHSQHEQAQVEDDEENTNAVFDPENEVIVSNETQSRTSQCAMLDNFKDYAQRANEFIPLDSLKFVSAIKLLQLLRRTKASLDTYEETMCWHLESQNLLHPRDSLAKSPHCMSRKQVYAKLRERCNRDQGFSIKTEIVLVGCMCPVGCRDLHVCWIKISTLEEVSGSCWSLLSTLLG